MNHTCVIKAKIEYLSISSQLHTSLYLEYFDIDVKMVKNAGISIHGLLELTKRMKMVICKFSKTDIKLIY